MSIEDPAENETTRAKHLTSHRWQVKGKTVKKFRQQIHYLLLDDDADSRGAQIVEYCLAGLITINIILVILSTMPELSLYHRLFVTVERISVALFTVEYILRIWAIGEEIERPVWGRIKYALRPLMIIDLIAVVPGYFAGALDLRFARSLRLIRILKLTRHAQAFRLIGEVLHRKRLELFSTALISGLLLIMASGMVYFAEHTAQPDVFSSIPEAMWWAAMTMTTVGYGDVTPITATGKIIGALVALMGVGFFAMPAGILASGFSQVIEERKERDS